MRRGRAPHGWPDERSSMVEALHVAHQARLGTPLRAREQPHEPLHPPDPTAWILRLIAKCGPVGIVQTALPQLLKAAYTQGRHDAMMDCLVREQSILQRYRNAPAAARARRKVLREDRNH